MFKKRLLTTFVAISSSFVITACTEGGNTGGTANTANNGGINQNLQLKDSGLTGSTCDGLGTWNANTVYSTANTHVVYNGKEYKNNWWTQGQDPSQNSGAEGSGQPWTFITDCGIAPTPSPVEPTTEPTIDPTATPTVSPTAEPTVAPSVEPTVEPTIEPSDIATYPQGRGSYIGGTIVYGADGKAYQCLNDMVAPWCNSTAEWAYAPGAGTAWNSAWELVVSPVIPTQEPTVAPTIIPPQPTVEPTVSPSVEPSVEPTIAPTQEPTVEPSIDPTVAPTVAPTNPPSGGKQLSIFWCGFGGDYCGQSDTDDVNPKATMVILAFANSNPDGSISVDDANWPTTLVTNWQRAGKKVIISVGGQNGHWDSIFANPQNFVNSVNSVINKYNIDGVDLDIEGYTTAPQAVSLTINTLRNKIGPKKLIVISPEVVGVYQGSAIPSPTTGGNAWNYFVPILNASIDQIDYVQPQEYNNWYDTSTMSSKYLMNGYLQWLNKDGLYGTKAFTPAQYVGVPQEKLIMGVLASTSAGGAAFYPGPQMLIDAINTLNTTYNSQVGGVMMWDSHWDTLNSYAISNAAAQALGL